MFTQAHFARQLRAERVLSKQSKKIASTLNKEGAISYEKSVFTIDMSVYNSHLTDVVC
jgi:hypothetical protein